MFPQIVCMAVLGSSTSSPSSDDWLYSVNVPEVKPIGGYYDNSVSTPHHAESEIIPITSFNQTIDGSHFNNLSYTSGNGISVSDTTRAVPRPATYVNEQGHTVETDTTLERSGSVNYTSPEGLPISLNYVADENGFYVQVHHWVASPPARQYAQGDSERYAPENKSRETEKVNPEENLYATTSIDGFITPSYAAPVDFADTRLVA